MPARTTLGHAPEPPVQDRGHAGGVQHLAKPRAAQYAGAVARDHAAAAMAAMSLARLRQILQTASVAELQRAAAAVYLAQQYQTLVMVVDGVPISGLDTTRMPAWSQITPETLRALKHDPVWQAWGRYQGLSPRLTGAPMGLAVAALGLLLIPDRLSRIPPALTPWLVNEGAGCGRDATSARA